MASASVSIVIPALINMAERPKSFCWLVNVALESCSHRPSKLITRLRERTSVKLFNCAWFRFSVKHSSQVNCSVWLPPPTRLMLVLLLLIIQSKPLSFLLCPLLYPSPLYELAPKYPSSSVTPPLLPMLISPELTPLIFIFYL